MVDGAQATMEPAGSVTFLLARAEQETERAHSVYATAARKRMVSEKFAEMEGAVALEALAALGGGEGVPPFVAKLELGEAPVLLPAEELGALQKPGRAALTTR